MPANKGDAVVNRELLVLSLTGQVFVGAFVGLVSQFALAIGVTCELLWWVPNLLDTAPHRRAVRSTHAGVGVIGKR
jgi:hypothetical protein